MSLINLPKTNQTGTNEWADVEDNDNAIVAVVNGDLDDSNIASGAAIDLAKIDVGSGVTDAQLASPNNSAYRTIAQGYGPLSGADGFYLLGGGIASQSGATVGLATPNLVYLRAADHAVAGKTTKLRLSVVLAPNAVTPSASFAIALAPVATLTGTGGDLIYTAGSGVIPAPTIASPAAGTLAYSTGSDTAFPSDGSYLFVVGLTGGLASGAAVGVHAHLQVRNV